MISHIVEKDIGDSSKQVVTLFEQANNARRAGVVAAAFQIIPDHEINILSPLGVETPHSYVF